MKIFRQKNTKVRFFWLTLYLFFQVTRSHAVTAKEELDGKFLHAYNRRIIVRFAIHGATVKLKELPHCVSNEMLYHACRAFGEVERAVVIVDEKGKPTGEGIVEFERKSSATKAIAQINDCVFLMSTYGDFL